MLAVLIRREEVVGLGADLRERHRRTQDDETHPNPEPRGHPGGFSENLEPQEQGKEVKRQGGTYFTAWRPPGRFSRPSAWNSYGRFVGKARSPCIACPVLWVAT